MLKKDVQVNGVYYAKVSGRRVKVKILADDVRGLNGKTVWLAKNLTTGRNIHIKSAQRLTPVGA